MTDKILLVIAPDYPSKHDEFNGCNALKNQIRYSKDMFKKVIVIAPVLFSFGMTEQDKFCKDYVYDNVEVYFPRCFFFPRIIKIPFISNYLKVFIDNRYMVTLNTIIRNNLTFDLIHARFTYPSMYIAYRLKKLYNVPLIATIHEDSGWFEEERCMSHPRFIEGWKSADILTRENSTELKLLQQYNPNVYQAAAGYDSLVFNSMDKKFCRNILRLNQSDKIVFTFGFLDERKGFQDLISAMSNLPEKYKGVKCYISGDGSYKKVLNDLIVALKLEKTVFIIDRCDDQKIVAWINASDLFIFPSLRESFGIIQIEALGCGVPVIASDNVGSVDIINSDCGFIYKAGNVVELAEKISDGLDKEWDKNKIVSYARTKYSWRIVSKQYDELYMKLLTT